MNVSVDGRDDGERENGGAKGQCLGRQRGEVILLFDDGGWWSMGRSLCVGNNAVM
jgi:hypothetical protein